MKGRDDMTVTQLCERLGISIPIIQAGMAGGPTTIDLVAAVSQTGALGTFGAGYLAPEKIRDAIKKIKLLTDKPFAVNLLNYEHREAKDEEVEVAALTLRSYRMELGLSSAHSASLPAFSFSDQLQVILEERIPIFSFTFGLLTEPQVKELHARDIVVIGTATTVGEAKILESLGVDMIVAQGYEAGGHRGSFAVPFESAMIGTLSLIPQVVHHVSCPVIAAGGIMEGGQMAAAFSLGASCVQMGTAFLTVTEAGTNELHKQAILNSRDTSTVVTNVFSGKPARGIQNEFIDQMTNQNSTVLPYPLQNALTRDIRKEAAKQGRTEWMSLWAGQSSSLARTCSAADLIHQVLAEYHRALAKLLPIPPLDERSASSSPQP